MTFHPDCLQLYFIMGSNNTNKDPVLVLEQAIKGGITCFQFREKGSTAKTGLDKRSLGRRLKDLCRQHDIPFVVNDDVDLAIELEADGVHIGQEDTPIEEVRNSIPSRCFIGLSTSTIEESIEAEKRGADYIGVGPMYSTKSKVDALAPIGVSGLQNIKHQISIPMVAIGGITKNTAEHLYAHGADGIAVISAISQASDPFLAARELSHIAKRYR